VLPAFLFDPASSPYSLRSQPAGESGESQPDPHGPAATAPALPGRLRAAAAHAWRLVPGRGAFTGLAPAQAEAAAAAEVLSEVQRVVALAKAFGIVVLLAVAGPATLLGPAARQRLAASVGLDGTPGAVVPLAVHHTSLAEPQGGDDGTAATSAVPPSSGSAFSCGSGAPAGGISSTSRQQGLGLASQSQEGLSLLGPSTLPEVGLLQAALYAHAAALHKEGAAGRGSLRGSMRMRGSLRARL